MPNWTAITTDTLNEASIAALITACDTAALADGQTPRAAGLIQGVVNEIRTAIAGCPSRLLDEDTTTIPTSLRDLAVDLIKARLNGALQIELNQDDRDTVAWRRRQLKEIRSCDFPIESPDTAAEPEVQSGPASELLRDPGANPFAGLGTT
ncbi:MAG: hypothetical protein FD161_2981 [Limisphaerales bacterium]|nr:MAG: hypothetical protein FD161_2981 [Limisphaerales bacterium]KAG0508094.1 MAG: hypothetical protein E1N63_2688 [Limisphaerales bacterium]TXT53053.1 MAG: hypothetical protein FD140_161 [Limisphaerales bacterium]